MVTAYLVLCPDSTFVQLLKSIMSNPEYSSPVGEFYFLSKLRYDLFLTVVPRHFSYFCSRATFKEEHKRFAFRLFCMLCSNLGLPRKRLLYFGRSEFGSSKLAHLHLLFSLDKCRRHHKYQDVKSELQDSVKDSLKKLLLEEDFLRGSFGIHCTSTGISHREGSSLASYISKEGYSPFRDNDLQNFMYPEDYIEKKFIEEVLKRECLDTDSEQSAAKTVWQADVRDGRWKDLVPTGSTVNAPLIL
jgi:hypothetical protein